QIVVVRRGGVIPNVEFVSKPGDGPIALPTKCPSCGRATRKEKDFLYCVNPQTCRDAVLGVLKHFTDTTGILGFGDKVLAQAYDKGILRSLGDFFRLKPE